MRYLLYLFISFSLGYNTLAYAKEEPPKVQNNPMNILTQVMDDIQQYYIYPVTQDSLFDHAIKGMMTGLDPHCAYFNNQSLNDLNTQVQGEFAGIGLEITMKHGVIHIVDVLHDSPSQKAHIQPGDDIIRLNGEPVLGMTLRTAINTMRGPVNSTVDVTLIRHANHKLSFPEVITLKRQRIHIESVKTEILNISADNTYGYIKITQFQANTADEMNEAITTLKKQPHLRGVILDLRNNPGGLFDSAIAVANDFIDIPKTNNKPEELPVIVSTRGRTPQSTSVIHATQGDKLAGIPMVVLVNSGSASSAEIVAGALKDNHRAILLGTKTFGKGSVQTLIPVTPNSAIKLTTALYYTPNGVSIQANGIEPDIIVKPINVKNALFSTIDDADQLTEADLKNHIVVNENNHNAETNDITSTKLQKDYLIYQALNILKGLALISH